MPVTLLIKATVQAAFTVTLRIFQIVASCLIVDGRQLGALGVERRRWEVGGGGVSCASRMCA